MEPATSKVAVKGRTCEDERCRTPTAQVWFCVDCDSGFCDDCWPYQAPHKPGKVARDGYSHEKAHYGKLKIYQDILQPPTRQSELQQMHEEDLDTLWFGVTKDHDGMPRFEDHGRFATLMAHSPSTGGVGSPKYPQLVSFVGVTNAGKSTIVKMLIDRHRCAEGAERFPSPVVGSIMNDKVPTSGDVHLYADPSSFASPTPRMFADCEGLEGGEGLPYGSQARRQMEYGYGSAKLKKNNPSKRLKGRPRNIAWADNEVRRKREYYVTELYPRLLYTFSDVIVFVLRNAKVFQSAVLSKLLHWGAAGLEKSINQPTLPHAIIVLNATEMGIDQQEWDPKVATARLLSTLVSSLDRIGGVPELQELALKWQRERNVEIRTVEDLLKRYYSSFTVVRIPAKGRYTLMDQQVSRLLQIIDTDCKEALDKKYRARMLSTADEWNVYLQAGFDHFTKNLDSPFNFIEVSLRNNPLPENFGDHIRQLATAIHKCYPDPRRTSGQLIFERLSNIVASCILLDCVQYRKGTVQDLFGRYEDYLDAALEVFCDTVYPCSYVSRKGQHCVNVAAGHGPKGHQDAHGKVIGAGDYESDFSSERYGDQWLTSVEQQLSGLQTELQQRDDTTSKAFSTIDNMFDLHRSSMTQFFKVVGGADQYISHTTCFSCLKEIPQHALPCGHVLCTVCVRAYGQVTGCNVTLKHCPLHAFDVFQEPWRAVFKPDYAGVRLLSLDGGGIRGIIELETLRAIELSLGCKLPIQAFFDLIVGTSTGGIIALAVGVKQWPIQKCIDVFMAVCDQAFQHREFKGVWGLEQMATLNHGSKYKTKPLRKALAESLGAEKLFGGVRDEVPPYPIKVAVTATHGTGRRPLVISNYNRAGNERYMEPYDFLRQEHPGLELGISEAAAATSAAPGYFKEFYHPVTNREFLDGSLYYNNPVFVAHHEAKLLWPDAADSSPDLLLSIGTGKNGSAVRSELRKQATLSQHPIPVAKAISDLKQANEASSEGPKAMAWINARRPRVLRTFKTLIQRFDSILDAELAWRDFGDSLNQVDWPRIDPQPFVRLNPDLREDPPTLDAKNELSALKNVVFRILHSTPMKANIKRVAFQLIASSFYFARSGHLRAIEGSSALACSGRICCRFENGSNELRELGQFMQNQQYTTTNRTFQPYFIVQERELEVLKITVTPQIITDMITHATFGMEPLEFNISNPLASSKIALGLFSGSLGAAELGHKDYPISGFPRCFSTEESRKSTRQAKAEPRRAFSKTDRRPGRVRRMRHSKDHEGSPLSPDSDGTSDRLSDRASDRIMHELSADPPTRYYHSSQSSVSDPGSGNYPPPPPSYDPPPPPAPYVPIYNQAEPRYVSGSAAPPIGLGVPSVQLERSPSATAGRAGDRRLGSGNHSDAHVMHGGSPNDDFDTELETALRESLKEASLQRRKTTDSRHLAAAIAESKKVMAPE